MADKLVGPWLPIHLSFYWVVGITGLALHLAVLWLLYRKLGYSFETSLAFAIGLALVVDFAVNNILTYRERRRKGWRIITGFLFYAASCSVGNLSNYALAQVLVTRGVWWPIAGIAGLAVGSVWNFAASEIVTWRADMVKRRTPGPGALGSSGRQKNFSAQ